MFRNRIPSRDLLKQQSRQERRQQSEFSQLQNAQFTQFDNSQDCYSQDQLMSVRTEPLGRRPSTLEKYLSGSHERTSLFKPSGGMLSSGRPGSQETSQTFKPAAGGVGGHSFQQLLSSQKARPKEKDDRDMLNSVVTIIKDCHEEVKQGLGLIKESDENVCENLRQTVLDTVRKSTGDIVKLLESQQTEMKDVHALHKELKQKDEQIKTLLAESREKQEERSERVAACMMEEIKSLLNEQQNQMEQKLQVIINGMKEVLQHSLEDSIALMATKHDSNQKELNVKQSKLYAQVQDVEKGLVHGLQSVKEIFKGQLKEVEGNVMSKLHMVQHCLQERNDQNTNQLLYKDLQENMQQLVNGVGDPERLTSELQDLCLTQKTQIEKYIKSQAAEQTKHIIKQNQDLQTKQQKQQKDFQRSLEQQLESMRSEQELFMSDVKFCLEDIKTNSASHEKSIDDNTLVKQLKEQLSQYQKQHQAGLQRLESKLNEQKPTTSQQHAGDQNDVLVDSKTNGIRKPKTTIIGNMFDFTETEMDATGDFKDKGKQSCEQKDKSELVAHCPPQRNWSNQPLFARAKPSPFATVLPQRHQPNSSPSTQDAYRSKQDNQVAVQPLQRPTVRVQADAPQNSQSKMELRSRPNSHLDEHASRNFRQDRKILVNNELKAAMQINDTSVQYSQNTASGDKHYDHQPSQKGQRKPKKKKGKKHCWSHAKARNQSFENEYRMPVQKPDNLRTQEVIESVTRHNQLHTYGRKDQTQTLAALDPARHDVYDFDEEERTSTSVFKRPNMGKIGTVAQYQPNRSNWLSSDDHKADVDSCHSSPSLAVSDLLIRRVVTSDRRSPERRGTITSDSAAMSYLLNTSGLGNICDSARQNTGQVQMRPEKRQLLDSDMVMCQIIQQKMRRLF